MVITDEVGWVAYGPCRVHQVVGYNNNATDDRYIQFHTKPSASLANGDIPVIPGLYAPAAAPFGWTAPVGGWNFSELTIAISSTQATYTAVTNTGLDLDAEIDSDFRVVSSTTLTGDLTTDVGTRTVWADGSGPKYLLRADVVNASGATGYAFVSGDVGDTAIDEPMNGPFKILNGATGALSFGQIGITPRKVNATSGALTEGCEIICSDSPLKDGSNAPVGTGFSIRAIYTA